ncbi:MAG: hypothetical protein MK108_12235, partial [Mariniblastus sp.]|nr:hypothetical protein [Mariniblastus sp.]
MKLFGVADHPRIIRCHFLLVALLICTVTWSFQADGQEIVQKIEQHLEYGEFPSALQLADSLDGLQRDTELRKIADAQFEQGAATAAYRSIDRISDDTIRFHFLANQYDSQFNPGEGQSGNQDPGSRGGAGQTGGITEADFEPLIDLIKTTIDP